MHPAPTPRQFRFSTDRKGKPILIPERDGSGWKTASTRLAEALGGRWTHRASGYHLSEKAAADFLTIWNAGGRGSAGIITGQKPTFWLADSGELSRREILALINKQPQPATA